MIREEYLTAAGVYFERLLLPIKDLPPDRLNWPLVEGAETTALDLFAQLAVRGERMVRALELLYNGVDADELLTIPYIVTADTKRSLAHFRIAHSTVMAALERVPDTRFSESLDLPDWLLTEYLAHMEQAVPQIEAWALTLRSRGQAGPTGLPVIQ